MFVSEVEELMEHPISVVEEVEFAGRMAVVPVEEMVASVEEEMEQQMTVFVVVEMP